jgi:serine/threonine protein kinase
MLVSRIVSNRTALRPGDILGRFQLLVPIGAGGMGRVWVAREQGLVARPRLVAIKTALAEEAASEDYWKVLLDEARIASQIQHPNVCSIHALDRERGVVYLVMDWSDGGSLRELLDAVPGGALEPTMAARIVAHVCAGLHAAHELVGEDGTLLHVVHRDVSPQNILLSANGHVKITDFGVAKARGQIHAPTQTGEVKGKLSYMAPEQVTTRDVDRRADVFALGCVLYEASLGTRPFHGEDALATLYQLLEQPIKTPSSIRADFPPGLERIILRSLEREADARFQTTEEMGRALQSWLASERAMVSDSDVAALIAQALGDRIGNRQQAVESALITMDSPAEPEPETEVLAPPNGIETLSGSAASTLPGNQIPRPNRKKLWAGLAVAGIGLSAIVAFANRGDPPPVTTPQPPSASLSPALTETSTVREVTPTATPQPVAPHSITVRIRTEPPNAELSIDDGPALPNPYALNTAPDAQPHRVRAKAAGYVSGEQDVAFDSDREVIVALRAAAGSGNRKPQGRIPVASPTPTPTPTPDPTPAASAHRGPNKKVPRTLDADNPFGEGQ